MYFKRIFNAKLNDEIYIKGDNIYMKESFLNRIPGTPNFLNNMSKSQIGIEPPFEEIKENGKHDTTLVSKVNVNVEQGGELTPEAQQEILSEEY